MNIRTFVSVGLMVALFLVGPALGVGVAADNSWQALQGVQATPMNAEEMEAVQGKGISPALEFLMQFGTGVELPNGGMVLGFVSDPGDSLIVSGMIGTGSSSFSFGPFQFGGVPQ